MIRFIVPFLSALVFLPVSSVNASDQDLLMEINRQPNGAEPRYRYALSLYSESRFNEAGHELERLLTRHPKHKAGLALKKHLTQLAQISDHKKQKEAQLNFLLQETASDMKSIETLTVKLQQSIERLTASTPKGVTENLERRKLLDNEYQISHYSTQYEESWEESLMVNAIHDYMDVKEYDKAKLLLQERMTKYPKSSRARYDWIVFLSRYGDATSVKAEIHKAYAAFPKNPEIRALVEKPIEQLAELFLDISLLRLEAHKSK